MRKIILFIGLLWCFIPVFSVNDTITIPLTMTTFQYVTQDGPTGSTPDPTDPNQFHASLVGNTLLIKTQAEQVSYVVIQERTSNQQGVDYFYDLSYGSVSCPITHAGLYTIRIGYWNTDFTGYLLVKEVSICDFNGHILTHEMPFSGTLPAGLYILRVETTLGTTTTKFYQQP